MTPVPAECSGRVLVLEADGPLPLTVDAAIGLCGLSYETVTDRDHCLSVLPARKPDLVLIVAEAWSADWATFAQLLDKRRITETLPVLFITRRVDPAALLAQVAQDDPCLDAFLAIRSLIRRERPFLLCQRRQAGIFVLDEEQFQIHCGDRSAVLSKVDACLFGPLFDVRDGVLERTMHSQLAFGQRQWNLDRRTIDVQIGRARRSIKRQLDHDPLRSIRGVGYALNDRTD